MPEFDDHRKAAKDELKRLEKLEKKIANLEKPRSLERFRAFFNGGTKKVLADTKTARTNLEQDITQKTSPGFLQQYRDWNQRVDREVDRQIKELRNKRAEDLNDTLSTLGVGGDIREKPKAPKQTTQTSEGLPIPSSGPLSVDEVLGHPKVHAAFEKFALGEGSPENLKLYKAILDFEAAVQSDTVSVAELQDRARQINNQFISTTGKDQVTVDNDREVQKLNDAIDNFNGNTSREELGKLFTEVAWEVKGMLEGTVQRFQKTEECKQLQAKYGKDGAALENVRQKMNYKGPQVGGSGGKNNIGV